MGSQAPQDPLRVEPIGYYNPSQFVHRPGILTALGIVSIIVAGLGLLMNCVSVFSTAMASNLTFPTAAPTTAAQGAGAAPVNAGPSRLSAANRELALSAFDDIYPLSALRRQRLSSLLDSVGDDPFPFAESNFTPEKIRQTISSSGPMPGDATKQFYIVANGRIEVSDDSAVFAPTNGNMVTVDPLSANAVYATNYSARRVMFTQTSLSIGGGMMAGMIGVAIVDFLLAGFLLYIAIRTLLDYPRARVLYLRYAALKFIVIIVGGVITWIWTNELYGQLTPGMPGMTATGWIAAISVIVNSIFAAILPTAIAIVMSTRSIKAYYGKRITEVLGNAG